METLRIWAIMLCAASVISAFVIFLAPDGAMKKVINIVLSLFFLVLIIYPLSGEKIFSFAAFDSDFLLDEDSAEVYSKTVDEYLLTNARNVVLEQVQAVLDDVCREPYAIDVDVVLTEDGNAQLKSVHIAITKADSASTVLIKTKIGAITGLVPEVEIK